jgi:hypothetical protein
MITRAEEVESYFGYWPLFCDGKIKSVAYVQPSTIVLAISYVDVEKQKAAEVTLTFLGVTDIELSELRSENVIDALRIPQELPAQVTIEACYGLEGSFNCSAIEVSSVVAIP